MSSNTEYQRTRDLTSWALVSYCALIYDCLLTFASETEYIWPTPWSIGKALYFLTKYPALVDGAMIIYTHSGPSSLSPSSCRTLLQTYTWFLFLGIIIAELVVGFRTWAVWGRSKRLGIASCILALVLIAPSCFLIWRASNAKNSVLPNMASLTCVLTSLPDKKLYIDISFIIVFESLMLALTLYKTWPCLRYTPSKLITTLYRDGIVFYLYLIIFSVINIATIARDSDIVPPFLQLQRVLHSIFTSRLLLNLHEAVFEDRARHLNIQQQECCVDTVDDEIALTTLVPGVESWFYQQRQHQQQNSNSC